MTPARTPSPVPAPAMRLLGPVMRLLGPVLVFAAVVRALLEVLDQPEGTERSGRWPLLGERAPSWPFSGGEGGR